MKKKAYMAPATYMITTELQMVIAGSIRGVGGDSGIGLGDPDDEIPSSGDSRRRSQWDDEEDDNLNGRW